MLQFDSTLHKVQYCLVVMTGISLLLPMTINNIIIGLLVLVSILALTKNRSFLYGHIGLGYFLILLLLASVIWLLFSCDFSLGLKKIEKTTAFFLFPFVLGTIKLSKSQLRIMGLVFSLTTILALTIAIVIAGFRAFENGSPYIFNEDNLVLENFFRYHRLSGNIGFHATYLSIYTAFSAFTILYFGLIEKKFLKKKPFFVWLLFLWALFQIYLLNSFAVIFSITIIGIAFILFLKNKVLSRKRMGIMVTFLCLIVIMVFAKKVRGIKPEMFQFSYETPAKTMAWNSMNVRLAKWGCALEVYRENPLLGVGTGCTQTELLKIYRKKGFYMGIEANYTSHNMYLRYLVQMGVIGFCLFVMLIVVGLYRAITKRNFLLFSLMVLLMITSITEEVLAINKGIIFFSFFIVFLQNTQTISQHGKERPTR